MATRHQEALPGSSGLRRWPAAAVHAPSEAAWLQEPVQEGISGLNVAALAELFPQGGEITVADLVAKGAVRDGYPVKVLGDGEVSAAYTIKGVKASASAKSKIELPAAPSPRTDSKECRAD